VSDRIRVIVVDDEPLARSGVIALLERDSELEIVGEAANGEEAVELIAEVRPDLVMLDVQMPGLSGFDVIRRIGPEHMPAVVFVTAYDQFAVRAFEVNAVDYLLKPFDDDRFAVTMARAKKAVRSTHVGELSRRLADLLEKTGTPAVSQPPARASSFAERLVVKSGGRVFFLRSEEVDWIEAADYYVKLHALGKTHLLRETMNALESRLDPKRFIRIHRSTIVNIDRLRKLSPSFAGEYAVVLHDGTKLKLSRGYHERIATLLKASL